MKAMIFAAGLGTRLGELTKIKPKALVEINGIPLLEIAIRRLVYFGFTDIIINVYHFADQIIEFVSNYIGTARLSVSDERSLLLDTGGGLYKASWFFDLDEDFLIYNTDILSNLNLLELYKNHIKNKSLATLSVRNRITSRYLLFDENNLLCGWKNKKTKDEIITRNSVIKNPFAFSGIQIVNPSIFKIHQPESNTAFSITNLYLELSKQNDIKACIDSSSYWSDVGKPEELELASKNMDLYLLGDE